MKKKISNNVIKGIALAGIMFSLNRLEKRYFITSQADKAAAPEWKKAGIDPAKSSDCKAWLVLDDTEIDYPVMQGNDNQEYLKKDPYGNRSVAGSIFLDYRNHSDFTDTYNIIYGHHMDNGKMFGMLDQYYDDAYFMDHQNGVLKVGDQSLKLVVFALAVEDASDEFFYCPGKVSAEEMQERIMKDALIKDDKVMKMKRIVAFSTCCKGGYDLKRTILFAWLE